MKRALTATAVAILIVAGSAQTGSASTINQYLSWTEAGLSGPCAVGATSLGYVSFTDPAVHSVIRLRSDTYDGPIETKEYNQNGVTVAERFRVCDTGRYFYYRYDPRSYKHRTFQQHWQDVDGGQRYLGTYYHAWESGTGTPM